MRIVFCYWKSIVESDVTAALKELNHEVLIFDEPCSNIDYDTDYLNRLASYLKQSNNVDAIFSINYIPIIARLCNVLHLTYISWIVDSPSLPLYSETLEYSCNHIFSFDRLQCQKFSHKNPGHIHHQPLGCNHKLLTDMLITDEGRQMFNCDVSFIGSLYDNRKYAKIKHLIPEYMQGYIDALSQAQANIYNYFLIPDSLSDDWVAEFSNYISYVLPPDYTGDSKDIIANFYLGDYCTNYARTKVLQQVSQNFSTSIYTQSNTDILPYIHNKGIADSHTMMPKIFNCSKINLNITSSTIQSGIPLRVFDIMSAGGFVISNYQAELAELFIPDTDIVLYESIPDLLYKIDYYLTHDDERLAIAQNGHLKATSMYSYKNQLTKILSIL